MYPWDLSGPSLQEHLLLPCQDKSFGLLAVSFKSLFISFFDCVETWEKISIGTAVLGYKEEGLDPHVLTTESFICIQNGCRLL